MSKVKYIIEVDKEDIETFLTKMNERYIINQYSGEESICGRVLLSVFKTATPITECDDCVSSLPKHEENGKGTITSNFKKDDWFILPGDRIFKILAPGMFSTAVRQMIKIGDDYAEGAIYIMHPNFIRFNAKRYKPYETEGEEK